MNKPNKTELEYFIRYSLDSDKYKRYMELYDEIERLNKENNILKKNAEHNDKVVDNVNWENMFFKEIIDKAIEYIEDNTYKSNTTEYMDLTGISELLDILKEGDKE